MNKIICDENIARWFVEKLREIWYEVLRIVEDGAWASDPDILKKLQEWYNILITYDSDFGELVFSFGQDLYPWNVIFCRVDIEFILEETLRFVTDIFEWEKKWYYIAIDANKVRIRNLSLDAL